MVWCSCKTKMKLFCIICIIHVSLQLKCDQTHVTAHVGGEFLITCSYNTNHYLYSKKYWCRGSSRHSCEVVVDSETKTQTQRWTVLDAGRRGLYVKVTKLLFEDAGPYWVGIDKIYADIMTSVEVEITEVPVSKPTLWHVTSLVGRPTCWGRAVTVRCGSIKGTNVGYEWYQQTHPEVVLVSRSPDLQLHCGIVQRATSYYCVARNNAGRQESDLIFVQVLLPAESHCIYAVKIHGQPGYDCADRLSTTIATTTCQLLPTTSQSQPTEIHSTTRNYSSHPNQTHEDWFYSRAWTTSPPWYLFLRWGFLLSMLTFLFLVMRCTKRKCMVNRVKKQRKTEYP